MNKYLLVYLGGQTPADPKEAEKYNAEWMEWFNVLGKSIVEMGAETKVGKVTGETGVKAPGTNPVTGYTVMQADSLDSAITLTKGCPGFKHNMKISVSEIIPM